MLPTSNDSHYRQANNAMTVDEANMDRDSSASSVNLPRVIPPDQGPLADIIAGLEDTLGLLQRQATTAHILIRSHQSRLTNLEGEIFVLHQEIASIKENSKTSRGNSE